MFRKIFILFICSLFLQGCIDNFKSYFKKSANNKYIDTKGFAGGKRRPLYNKKYISVAKRNIAESNYEDEDDEPETMSPSRINREMYKDMLRKDALRKKHQSSRASRLTNKQETNYPSLREAKVKSDQATVSDAELQQELQEIKQMLNETKRDLVKYKCPITEKIKQKQTSDSIKKFSDE